MQEIKRSQGVNVFAAKSEMLISTEELTAIHEAIDKIPGAAFLTSGKGGIQIWKEKE